MEKYGKYLDGKPIDNNKFMKILIKCGVTLEQLQDYVWYVEEVDEPHKFYCSGFHPVAARIGITKSKIVV